MLQEGGNSGVLPPTCHYPRFMQADGLVAELLQGLSSGNTSAAYDGQWAMV